MVRAGSAPIESGCKRWYLVVNRATSCGRSRRFRDHCHFLHLRSVLTAPMLQPSSSPVVDDEQPCVIHRAQPAQNTRAEPLARSAHSGHSGRVGQAGVAVHNADETRPWRTALIFVGLAVIAGAVWFAASWIDVGDSTCGSALQPAAWSNSSACEPVMPLRLAVAVAAAVVGGLVVFVGARGTWRDRRLLGALLAGCGIVVLTVLLIVNEFVRSDGLWNH